MRLTLLIRIEYEKHKAADLVDMERSEAYNILRKDVSRFKLPHPPVANMREPTNNGIEFSYTTFDESGIFCALLWAFEVREPHPAVRRAFSLKNNAIISALKARCSIVDMTLQEFDEWGRETRRRPRSPSPSVPKWRREDRKPLARYNGSSERWIKHGAPTKDKKKLKVKDNRPEQVADRVSEHPVHEDTSAVPESTAAIVARLTREFWDTRRGLANAAARGMLVESQIRVHRGPSAAADSTLTKQVQQQLELTLEKERAKLQVAEKILEDVLRECETPAIVPELLKLAEMFDEDAMSEDE
ncbi:hypothetical protein DFH06DRAFT_1167506 [Mycena polygramma]|nr:hypothetical protein DFH06DRAFT_1167506 [Mycena polygramma]